MSRLNCYILPRLLISVFLADIWHFVTDLEEFKTQRRSPVSVREGQGVVLLCGPPAHMGGEVFYCLFSG